MPIRHGWQASGWKHLAINLDRKLFSENSVDAGDKFALSADPGSAITSQASEQRLTE